MTIAFSGDVLFQGSIGRTELPGGSHEQLLESIVKGEPAAFHLMMLGAQAKAQEFVPHRG